jgi:hypothetical protein
VKLFFFVHSFRTSTTFWREVDGGKMEGRNAEQEEGSLKGEVNPTAALFKRQVRTLQEAGKEIEKMLQREEEFPELSDMFNQASSTSVDYVTDLRPHFRLLKMVPLPETLHQMYKCKTTLPISSSSHFI